jgi:hypothetical protein
VQLYSTWKGETKPWVSAGIVYESSDEPER